jgi:hypothetical protein
VVKSFVAHDLANLRWAFRDDALFARAIEATAREVLRALKSPRLTTLGRPLEHDLSPWRRSAFSSSVESEADLRLVFRRARATDAVDIIAFGKRRSPDIAASIMSSHAPWWKANPADSRRTRSIGAVTTVDDDVLSGHVGRRIRAQNCTVQFSTNWLKSRAPIQRFLRTGTLLSVAIRSDPSLALE